MSHFQKSFQNTRTIGAISFLILIVLSIVFWKERVFLFDNAYQLFLLFCEERIEVMAHRWPAAIVRVVPLLGVKLGLPLIIIALSFSLSYIFIHLLFFFLILWVFKNPTLALLQIALIFLLTSEGFYWCNSEQAQGMSAVILFASIVSYNDYTSILKKYLWLIFGVTTVIFYHPLLLFPAFFLLVFDLLEKKDSSLYRLLAIGLLILGWILKRSFFVNWYDTAKSEAFERHFETWVFQMHKIPSLDFFINELFVKYHFFVLGLIVSLILLLIKKRWLPILLVIGAILVYLTIVLLGNPAPKNSFYVEINFYTLGVFVFYPILFYLTDKQRSSSLFLIVFSALLLFSTVRIISFSHLFTQRIEWINDVLPTLECNKTYIRDDQYPKEIKMLTWSIAYETMLHSSSYKENKSIHPFIKKYESKYRFDLFVTSFNVLNVPFVNNKYFELPTGDYCPYIQK